jgi:lipopolysaccharide biosynthesis glycosyltransferase
MSKFRLAVVYIGDANYHELTLYSLASIARSHQAPLDLHLMQSGYDAAIDPAFARLITSRGHRLFATRAAFKAPGKGARTQANTYAYITDTMFLKAAALEALAAQYDYILYMDADMLAFGDLRLDTLAGFTGTAAACIDMTIAIDAADPSQIGKFRNNTPSPRAIFNSGMILVNAQEWRRRNTYTRFQESLIQHQSEFPYFRTCEPNDQCALNMALAGSWRPLDLTMNVQKVAMHTGAWSRAMVRHYTGRNKFLPLNMHRCDKREYALLCSISREAGLPHPGSFYDGGLSYWLNGLRRFRAAGKAERAIARVASD